MTSSLVAEVVNDHYPANRPPLTPSKFVHLPVGAVKPTGWLKDQLVIQSNGLTGHLDEFWPSLTESRWKNGTGRGWERAPYYLDGLVPLAYILEDERLIEKVKSWIEPMIASAQPNGWFGPDTNNDRWPLAVACKVLTQYYEATGDERAIKVIEDYLHYLATHPPDWPDNEWRGARAMEHAVTAYWLYNRTGDPELLKTVESIYLHSWDWTSYFLNFIYDREKMAEQSWWGHASHVVNIAMAIKHPGMWYQQAHNLREAKAVFEGIKSLEEEHGQVAGRFSGDEHLSGKRPTQGTELCAVAEYMFSLENLIAALGDPMFGDRLELLAYNAKPSTCTPDYWAHQYDQQGNQVLVTLAPREWSTNRDEANLYGLEPHFGCCLANMHQTWPKFVKHMWMAAPGNGLAAVALGPSQVTAKVADGTEVTITETTEYPFEGGIEFKIETPKSVTFPLQIRIPDWAHGASLEVGGKKQDLTAGTFATVDRTWSNGDVLKLDLPMNIRLEERYNKAVSVLRGPLYFGLKIGEDFRELKRHHDELPVIDWEIYPTTPWNYGLIVDRENPQESFEVSLNPVSEVPFANEDAPVVLKVKAKRIPEWHLEHNSAGETPVSPVTSDQPVEEVTLIPYGNTRLRITEFPVIGEGE